MMPPHRLIGLAYTASRMSQHKYRTAFAVSVEHSKQERVDLGQGVAHQRTASVANQAGQKIAFVFSGIGTQWNGEGAQLYAAEPVFRATVDLCDSLFDRNLKVREAYANATQFKADDLVRAHAVHFTLQLALYELWNSWGVIPNAVVGHSMGEVAAACTAGCVDLPNAVKLVYERAARIQPYANKGLMLAAALDRCGAGRNYQRPPFTDCAGCHQQFEIGYFFGSWRRRYLTLPTV